MGKKQLTLSNNSVIGGVCGGLAEYFEWDPTLVRIIFILLAVFGVGSPILIYLVMWLIIPEKKTVL